jgi:putative thioredoxin
MAGAFVIDVTDETFQQEVVERSMSVPVIVDFWAPWCAPCRALGPVLEKLADDDKGRWILAKINTDQSQQVASYLGIRGIPAVKAIFQGQLIDEFSGALPAQAVRQWLDRFLPPAGDEADAPLAADDAHAAWERGDHEAAANAWRAALQADPNDAKALVGLARIAMSRGDEATTRALLGRIPEERREAVAAEIAALELRLEVADAPPRQTLEDRVAADPNDHEARYQLALILIAEGDADRGLGLLLEIVRRDRQWQDDQARKTMVRAFEILGVQSDTTIHWRKRLGAIMYV